MIDTHCHIGEDIYKQNIDELVSTLQKYDVDKVFCVGYSTDMNNRCISLANKYENVYAIIGIHPSEANEWNDQTRNTLEKMCENKKVLAIGEIGLDYHFDDCPSREQQKLVFIEQIKLAYKLHLPFVVHCRDAVKDVLDIFNEYSEYITNGGVIHCFGESFESYKQFAKYGFKVSFGGAITFKNANRLVEVVKNIPIDDILLETDCPYLTPVPYRGQTNYPHYVYLVADKIAELKNMSVDQVKKITTDNAYKVFGRLK